MRTLGTAMRPRSNVPCGSCHLCCHGDLIVLFEEKGDDIASYEHEIINGLPIVKKTADGKCVYLGDSGCTIHDRAPAICRHFDCRGWFLSKTRQERRRMVKDGIADRAIFARGRELLESEG